MPSVGSFVKRGELVGYSASHGESTGPHLHIDFSHNTSNTPVVGYIQDNKYIYDGKEYPLRQEYIDSGALTLIDTWKQQSGETKIGYCWLVLAADTQAIQGDDD